ncbi:hypothetical protein [Catenuloplanes indicus]|uniref:Tetratricopeptide (TPR) repeat protein n=1 Tax=Catenuloplanes indicus TaxID=137267 RepID=A0AAE3W0C4_9ACTN|nr:hypothetical protein [Catenuloplanes indicus]MDQ0366927.1 tetratricopeptide (TPR) repeat protein [Catenuloplanes indicus]
MTGCFADRYHTLPAPLRACARAFAAHPGPEPTLPVLAAALATTDHVAAAHIDQLVRADLVRPAPGSRWRIYSQARTRAATDLAADPTQQLFTARINEWYLARARAASTAAAPYRTPPPAALTHCGPDAIEFATPGAALDWLDAERVNLLTLAGTRSTDDPHMVWALLDAIRPLFEARGFPDDRRDADALALDCAERVGDPAWLSHAWRRYGWRAFDFGNHPHAADAFKQAIKAAAGIPHDRTRVIATASASEGLAMLEQAENNVTHALQLLRVNRGVYAAHGDYRSEGLSALNRAVTLINARQPGEALDALAAASDMLARAGTDPYRAALVGVETGRALAELGDHTHARIVLVTALREMTKLDRPRGRALALHYLGDLAITCDDLDQARAFLHEAADIYAGLCDRAETAVQFLLDDISAGA